MYKDILPIIDLDIIVLVILAIILFMYRLKFNMQDKINKLYFSIVTTTMAVIVLEVLDKLILVNNSNSLIPITKIINVLGFSLAPIVPYLWMKYLFSHFNIKANFKLLQIPLLINLILCVMSYNYGYVFTVTEFNTYYRGPFHIVPMNITLLYFFTSLVLVYKNKLKSNSSEFLILMLFSALPIIAAIIQIFFNNLLLIWGFVGISIITHYIYLQETLLRYDTLTGVWNRMTFESYFNNKYLNKNNGFSLIYADADDFKGINDNFGHNEGDVALKNISKTLKICFSGIGKVARLGGDEFIIVADICDKNKLKSRIDSIYLELDKLNKKNNKNYKLKLSLGYKTFDNEHLSLGDYIKEIDELMYLDKKNNKNKSQNRA